MRLYLKALCNLCGPEGYVDSLVLNDEPARDPRLANYTSATLQEQIGCRRSKCLFIFHALRLGRRNDRVVCAHLHLLPIARLLNIIYPRLDYFLIAHGIEVWRPYSWIERWALRGARRILCISDYTRRQMQQYYPDLAAGVFVIVPNTLDPELSPAAVSPMPRSASGLGPTILSVGRLNAADAAKGFDTLIEAMVLIRQNHPQATLRIVGGGDDESRLRALANQHGLTEVITFTGIIDDVSLQAEYAACDIFALPSRKEGFGLVFLEAMIHGKPCLGARAGGVPEVINEGVGVLADYGSIPEIAAAVTDLVQYPRNPAVIRAHADSFAFPAFSQRLAAALSA
jgi:glycosyltransferase involved in cell wall biosynthesis